VPHKFYFSIAVVCSPLKKTLKINHASKLNPAAIQIGRFRLIDVKKPAIIGGIARASDVND